MNEGVDEGSSDGEVDDEDDDGNVVVTLNDEFG